MFFYGVFLTWTCKTNAADLGYIPYGVSGRTSGPATQESEVTFSVEEHSSATL